MNHMARTFKPNPLPMHIDFVSKQLMGAIINQLRKAKQANYALKTESVKNRTVCSNMYSNNTYATSKIMKNLGTREQFVY